MKTRKKNHYFPVAVILIFMLFLGLKLGSGQQQDVSRWSADTHQSANFPLLGRHRTVPCRDCHLGLVFQGTPKSCESCHWERRQDDRYQLRLGRHCEDCHDTFSWKNIKPGQWSHVEASGYRLEGIHSTLDCVECHGTEGFTDAVADCLNCHEKDLLAADDPDHSSAGFPVQCLMCHFSNSTWEGGSQTSYSNEDVCITVLNITGKSVRIPVGRYYLQLV